MFPLPALLSVVVAAAPLDTPVGFMGPLGAVQLSPLRMALIDVPARGVVMRPWLRVERSSANVWMSDTVLLLPDGTHAVHGTDAQLDSVLVDAGLPLGGFGAVGVRWGSQRLWGGGPIDATIERFHREFDFYNFARHVVSRDRTDVRMETTDVDGNVRGFHWTGPRELVPSPLFSAFLRVLENRTTSLQVRADAQLPLGDVARALALDGPELALGMVVWRRFDTLFAVHLSAHALWHGQARVGGMVPLNPQLLGQASLELRVLPFLTVLLEDRMQAPLFAYDAMLLTSRTLSPRSTAEAADFTPANFISGGVRVYLPTQTALTFWVGEDFLLCYACRRLRYSRETSAPDVSAALSFEQVLPEPR